MNVSANCLDVGEMVNGCAVPVSRALTVPPSVAVAASHAVRDPAPVGTKDAVTVQLPPPARLVPAQPSDVRRKWAASGPDRLSATALVGVAPTFVTV
jgi:hypothetical protein